MTDTLEPINLNVSARMQDPEFRRHWRLAELEAAVADSTKRARLSAGLTQTKLAEKSGLMQPAISRVESTNGFMPTLEPLRCIAAALGMKVVVKFEEAKRP